MAAPTTQSYLTCRLEANLLTVLHDDSRHAQTDGGGQGDNEKRDPHGDLLFIFLGPVGLRSGKRTKGDAGSRVPQLPR